MVNEPEQYEGEDKLALYEPMSMMFAYRDAGVTVALPRFWDAGPIGHPQPFDLEAFLTQEATSDIQRAAALRMVSDWYIDHTDDEMILREDVDEDVDRRNALATLMLAYGVDWAPLLPLDDPQVRAAFITLGDQREK